ncbi:MAG: 30S ribosomal protein S8e [Candidatus Methanomethylicia archaeon]|nr:30S ribosomal protein S8e [Candidatus Methanomethylicia archaeon]MCX8169213.1 30S ribosomal protein S8e [Candidatus Methanomethylicia archaeon]MDW7989005.1 30S ribosomal protein S8e [Nitrososphaerota archaeon]
MSYYQGNDFKKPSGGKKRKSREKRKHELGRPPTQTILGEKDKRIIIRTRGGGRKIRLKVTAYANVVIKDDDKTIVKKAKILKVKSNPANPDYSRRGVITRGAIIETSIGEAKVTSRPGQDGVINAILIKKG